MSEVIHEWPFLIMLGVVGVLVYLVVTGRQRPPLQVVTAAHTKKDASATEAIIELADLMRSGVFYMCEATLDWKLCCDLAARLVSEAAATRHADEKAAFEEERRVG